MLPFSILCLLICVPFCEKGNRVGSSKRPRENAAEAVSQGPEGYIKRAAEAECVQFLIGTGGAWMVCLAG